MDNFLQRLLQARLQPSHCFFVLVSIALLALVACGPPEAPAANEPAQPDEVETDDVEIEGEPLAVTSDEAVSEPAPAEESYPSPPLPPTVVESYPADALSGPNTTPVPEHYPGDTEIYQEPRFRLDTPINANSTIITGQAPPGLDLAIVDVTYNGALLGTGSSESDGQFSINVQNLVEGNRVGITFGTLEPGMTIGEMSIKYYPHRGEGFMNLPNLAILLDTATVKP